MATKEVNIDIIAKDKTQRAMQSATRGVNNLTNNVKRSVESQQRSFLSLGSTIKTVLGAVAVIQTARFSANMVQMASAVEEMQSKSSVVFGKFVSSVRKDLEKFGDNVGRSTFELEKMASSIQDTFVPMGFAREEASKLSIQLTKLAVDVASFNNANDTETMQAFQSALVGNHETVRRFGVVITEATLKQELLRMGITKTASEITNAEKVQARLNLIIAGTSDAHNDAIRTSGSFANQSKALGSALEELQVAVMQPLLPLLTSIVKGMTEATKSTTTFLQSVGLIPRNFEDTKKTALNITRLLKKQADVQEHLAKLTKPREIEHYKKILAKINEQIQAERDLLKLGDQRIRQQNQLSDVVAKSLEKQKKLIKEIKEEQKRDATGIGIDASMGGVPVNAHLNAFTNEERLEGVKNIATQEFEVMKKVNDDKIKAIMENDELQLELQRIHSEEKLKIAQETANKQLEIEKKLMKDNFEAMKTGQFQNLKLANLSKEQEKEIMIEGGKQILSGVAQNNRQAFALNKAYNMAEAIMNTARGVASALPNIPMALLIGAMGAVQIATISQTKYQGRRLGGRMNQGEPYMVGEAGAELVVPDRPSNVIPNNKLPSGQPVTVNFNISTVDARGFNELLVNSRGTIVNLINTAVNEKGKMAII